MHLLLLIAQGAGLSAAVGIRPILPGLLAGALAAGNLGVDFDHTRYAFLESPGFLLALVLVLLAATVLERRLGAARAEAGPLGAAVAGLGLGLGALLFAGSLADEGYVSWPGLVGGLVCAALAQAAVRSLFRRTRARLDAQSGAALSIYGEGAGLLLAGLSVLAPPVGIVALALLAWLLVTGRRREGRKYAGLRVLR